MMVRGMDLMECCHKEIYVKFKSKSKRKELCHLMVELKKLYSRRDKQNFSFHAI